MESLTISGNLSEFLLFINVSGKADFSENPWISLKTYENLGKLDLCTSSSADYDQLSIIEVVGYALLTRAAYDHNGARCLRALLTISCLRS